MLLSIYTLSSLAMSDHVLNGAKIRPV